jgi:hypothetical protein
MGTGGVYVSMRNLLRDKYLTGWMSAAHELNREAFADMVFEMTKRIVAEKNEEGKFSAKIEKGEIAVRLCPILIAWQITCTNLPKSTMRLSSKNISCRVYLKQDHLVFYSHPSIPSLRLG